ALPEAQLDRFLVRLQLGYPEHGDEVEMLERRLARRSERVELDEVVDRERFSAMQDAVEHFLGRPTGPIRFIGGGASSDVWCQIHADVMERPVHQVAQPLLANVRGAALYAALALGKIDLRAAATASEVAQVFEPRSEHRHVYRELYGQFRTLYRQQHRMYAALNRSGGPFDRSEDP
ncbi:MAG: FGGY-family carbohydrate kinase, partial [Actinomycetota bacterium]|nr:FGGY-family carbohydrate kinase [Actinomycetota bacterium]